jgi:hypothetical protein
MSALTRFVACGAHVTIMPDEMRTRCDPPLLVLYLFGSDAFASGGAKSIGEGCGRGRDDIHVLDAGKVAERSKRM